MSDLALDAIRKNVAYQNTVDIWIAMCQEHNVDWNNTEMYKKFIAYLLQTELTMKKFPLCICLLYTSPSPRDLSTSRMPSSA